MFAEREALGHRQSFVEQRVEMLLDRFFRIRLRFFERLSRRVTTRNVGHHYTERMLCVARFDRDRENQVFHFRRRS